VNLEDLIPSLLCPNCSGLLHREEDSLRCKNCAEQFPVEDEIPIFAKDKNFYYGEISEEAMKNVLKSAKNTTVADSLRKYTSSEFILNYALAKERSILKLFTDISDDKKVLDLGCGWGNISLALAGNVKEIIAADLTALRLQFLKKRCFEENVTNITCVCLGDRQKLPFSSGIFDLVILNGVLEWIPESIDGNPLEIQKKFMQEVVRILKPHGQVFIGIENRIGYGYLRGAAEDHTGLKYGSLIPRSLANIYSRWKRKKPYRTYTYTKIGYERLLKKAGFQNVKFYGARPNYRNPRFVADLHSRKGISTILKRKTLAQGARTHSILHFIADTKLSSFIMPSFMIVASPTDNLKSVLIDAIRDAVGSSANFHWLGSAMDGRVVAHFKTEKEHVIARTSTSDSADRRVRNNWSHLHLLSDQAGGQCKDKIPKPITAFACMKRLVTLETMLPGTPIPQVSKFKKDITLKEMESFLDCLHGIPDDYHNHTNKQSNANNLSDFLNDLIYRVNNLLISDRYAPLPNEIINILFNHPDLEKATIGRIHGDFTPSNILINKKTGQVTGVIDWDVSEAKAATFIDYMHFNVWMTVIYNKSGWEEVMISMGKTILAKEKNNYNSYCNTAPEWWSTSLWAYVVYCIWYQVKICELGVTWEGRLKACNNILSLIRDQIAHGKK